MIKSSAAGGGGVSRVISSALKGGRKDTLESEKRRKESEESEESEGEDEVSAEGEEGSEDEVSESEEEVIEERPGRGNGKSQKGEVKNSSAVKIKPSRVDNNVSSNSVTPKPGSKLQTVTSKNNPFSTLKDLQKKSPKPVKLNAADLSQGDSKSVDTVKIQHKGKSAPAKKKKKMHKVTACVYHDLPESSLFRHFLDTGEWKKVPMAKDPDFTYVCSEKKLNWDITLKTMVGSS
jgi:hypothetical protein